MHREKRSNTLGSTSAMAEEQFLLCGISSAFAHDLQNWLSPVATCLQLAEASGTSSDQTAALLPTARRNLEMALAALRHAREFAELGKPAFERLRLDTLASEAVALLEPVWREKRLGIELTASNGLEISADRVLLQRLLANLLSNAIKASPRGSSLAVSVQPLASRAQVQLVIEDHGPGLELHETSVNESTQPNAGLGLRICRRIVELHGGELEFKDRADGGTRVVVELPLTHR